MPIGINAIEEISFTNHKIPIKTNDCIYIFSDGFTDQFGGPKGKKFKYKPFQQLLTEIHDKPMNEQKVIFEHTIEEWKAGTGENVKSFEQVDDILIIGIRL